VEKPTDLPQVTDWEDVLHNVGSSTPHNYNKTTTTNVPIIIVIRAAKTLINVQIYDTQRQIMICLCSRTRSPTYIVLEHIPEPRLQHGVCYICFQKGTNRLLYFKECVSIMLSNTTINNISAMLWCSGPVLWGVESNAVKHAVCCCVYLNSRELITPTWDILSVRYNWGELVQMA
jgi:hypothetical protein